MNETKIKELTEQISKATVILNDLTDQLEAEKNKATEKKEPSIEDRWKPKPTDKYFHINGDGYATGYYRRDGNSLSNQRYRNYNTWKSIGRAEEVFNKTKLLWLMEQIHDILCPDYKPDWNNTNEEKYFLYFDAKEGMWLPSNQYCYTCVTFTIFDIKEHAEQACKILNDMGVKPC